MADAGPSASPAELAEAAQHELEEIKQVADELSRRVDVARYASQLRTIKESLTQIMEDLMINDESSELEYTDEHGTADEGSEQIESDGLVQDEESRDGGDGGEGGWEAEDIGGEHAAPPAQSKAYGWNDAAWN